MVPSLKYNSYFSPLLSFLGKGTPRGHKISDYFEVRIFSLTNLP